MDKLEQAFYIGETQPMFKGGKELPKWEIHNKWAEKLGVPVEISDFVNRLIDSPEEVQEFMEFCDREYEKLKLHVGSRKSVVTLPLKVSVGKHDSGRKSKTATHLQLEFLRKKGSEYVKAWYLHHILDYMKSAPKLSVKEVLKRVEEKTESCRELEIVKNFVMSRSEEISRECRVRRIRMRNLLL